MKPSIRFRNRVSDSETEYAFGVVIQRFWEAGYRMTCIDLCFGVWALTFDWGKRGNW